MHAVWFIMLFVSASAQLDNMWSGQYRSTFTSCQHALTRTVKVFIWPDAENCDEDAVHRNYSSASTATCHPMRGAEQQTNCTMQGGNASTPDQGCDDTQLSVRAFRSATDRKICCQFYGGEGCTQWIMRPENNSCYNDGTNAPLRPRSFSCGACV